MTTKHIITTGSRSFFVHDHRDDAPEHVKARRAILHPAAEIVRVETVTDPRRGAFGVLRVAVEVEIPLVAAAEEAGWFLERDHGDAGGPGDALIAEAARRLTGLSDPIEVARALAKHHVATVEDLHEALGLGPGEAISDEMRNQIGEALALVDPPLPEWVIPGVLVVTEMCVDRVDRVCAVRVDRAAVGLGRAGAERWMPAGIFLRSYWRFDANECEDARLMYSAAEALGIEFQADVGFSGLRELVRCRLAAMAGNYARAATPSTSCEVYSAADVDKLLGVGGGVPDFAKACLSDPVAPLSAFDVVNGMATRDIRPGDLVTMLIDEYQRIHAARGGYTEEGLAAERGAIDAAIAVHDGPHHMAFGAALRCLVEYRHPSHRELTAVIAGLQAYEAAREKGMVPKRAEQEASDAVGLENDGAIPGCWDKVLAVYERERSR